MDLHLSLWLLLTLSLAPQPAAPSAKTVDMLLQKIETLEQRIQTLERGDNALRIAAKAPALVSQNIRNHLKNSIKRIANKEPLPGLKLSQTQIMRSPQELAQKQQPNINLTMADAAADPNPKTSRPPAPVAVAMASKMVGDAAAKSTYVAAEYVGAAADASRRYASKAVGTAVGVANLAKREVKEALTTAQAVQNENVAASSQQSAQFALSRKLLSAALLGGSAASLAIHLALGLPRSTLLLARSALLGSGMASYALTLSNQLGSTARLIALVVLALCTRVGRAIAEWWRQATFVYKTGRWFEQIDSQIGSLDQALGQPRGAVGKSIGSAADALGRAFESARDWTNTTIASESVTKSIGSWVSLTVLPPAQRLEDQVGNLAVNVQKGAGSVATNLQQGLFDLQREWFVAPPPAWQDPPLAPSTGGGGSSGGSGGGRVETLDQPTSAGVLDAASTAAQLLDSAAAAATARITAIQEQILRDPPAPASAPGRVEERDGSSVVSFSEAEQSGKSGVSVKESFPFYG